VTEEKQSSRVFHLIQRVVVPAIFGLIGLIIAIAGIGLIAKQPSAVHVAITALGFFAVVVGFGGIIALRALFMKRDGSWF
jgi:uncharacterized membrane protein